MRLLMSKEAAVVAGLRPALARLANAMVAVLGPELTLGSSAYSKTRSLLQDVQVGSHFAGGSAWRVCSTPIFSRLMQSLEGKGMHCKCLIDAIS